MRRKLSGIFILSMILSSCSLPGMIFNDYHDPGSALAVGEEVAIKFFTSDANFDTGVNLRSGSRYSLDIKILSHWIDNYIEENENNEPLDERGFSEEKMAREFENSWLPYDLARLTKRSKPHRWFELMLMQYNCAGDSLQGVTDLTIDEASGNYNFVAACDGKLTLFVNDSHGFYGNNAGFANLSLSRVN